MWHHLVFALRVFAKETRKHEPNIFPIDLEPRPFIRYILALRNNHAHWRMSGPCTLISAWQFLSLSLAMQINEFFGITGITKIVIHCFNSSFWNWQTKITHKLVRQVSGCARDDTRGTRSWPTEVLFHSDRNWNRSRHLRLHWFTTQLFLLEFEQKQNFCFENKRACAASCLKFHVTNLFPLHLCYHPSASSSMEHACLQCRTFFSQLWVKAFRMFWRWFFLIKVHRSRTNFEKRNIYM